MRGIVLAGLAAVMLLAGCATRLNPLNWFGGSEAEPVTAVASDPALAIDPRPTVDQIARMQVDRVPGGALVTAVALPPTQDYYDADLVALALDVADRPAAEDGVLSLRFVAVPPPVRGPVGSEASREISAGIFLSDQTLQGVRTITVRAARNQRSARR